MKKVKMLKRIRLWYDNLLDDQKLSLAYSIIATIQLVLNVLIAIKLHSA